jgi:hypothetical protein
MLLVKLSIISSLFSSFFIREGINCFQLGFNSSSYLIISSKKFEFSNGFPLYIFIISFPSVNSTSSNSIF